MLGKLGCRWPRTLSRGSPFRFAGGDTGSIFVATKPLMYVFDRRRYSRRYARIDGDFLQPGPHWEELRLMRLEVQGSDELEAKPLGEREI